MDADSLMLSFDEIRKATGLEFDVQGHSNKNHLFKIEEYIKENAVEEKYLEVNPDFFGFSDMKGFYEKASELYTGFDYDNFKDLSQKYMPNVKASSVCMRHSEKKVQLE